MLNHCEACARAGFAAQCTGFRLHSRGVPCLCLTGGENGQGSLMLPKKAAPPPKEVSDDWLSKRSPSSECCSLQYLQALDSSMRSNSQYLLLRRDPKSRLRESNQETMSRIADCFCGAQKFALNLTLLHARREVPNPCLIVRNASLKVLDQILRSTLTLSYPTPT